MTYIALGDPTQSQSFPFLASTRPLPQESEQLFSADSHVLEPGDLWQRNLPPALVEALPPMPRKGFDKHPGGTDPLSRPEAMAADGVCGEILYPSLALHLFSTESPQAQAAAFRLYNDWVRAYCQALPDRLVGIGCLPAYDVSTAVAELERCRTLGLKGVMIWQSPPPSLPLHSPHYEPLWQAAATTGTPLSFHALTGFHDPSPITELPAWDNLIRRCVASKLNSAVELLYTLIFHGVLSRHPNLRIVLVENHIGWIPWLLQRWDHYAERFQERLPFAAGVLPSELFHRQVSCTFLADDQGCEALQGGWGINNCLWSNDFPHGDSSWPESRQLVDRKLGSLPPDARARLLRENVCQLYGLELPAPLVAPTPQHG
ncbi:MAG: amidohydrolase family protein [Cyanobacteriota bacterium]|nr:amidohydrolase family protein [Cyanobacteriota bacterium]